MDERLRKLLEDVKAGEMSIEEALSVLHDLPYQDLSYAVLDHHRGLRKGFPEVVFCQGKSPRQVIELISELSKRNDCVMATRADEDTFQEVKETLPGARYYPEARIIVVDRRENRHSSSSGDENYVLVVSAGTSDIPVAEEAAITAEVLGSRVERLYDVGVAGLHRLLGKREKLFGATVIIAVAGMEGALASVVGGLVPCPVVAVPTSVGYGASFEGLAPLLTMLNSCAPGVAVVNVDNGFGAGYFAHNIMQVKGGK
ncbi:MAG: nickel pincer cofactor biosynthesis protein LarB [Anaerolineae bacterium]|nr:nickel pincer cofactor biosynthesis protein LarB [Anaerolineae bacterium]NIN93398.1 nickel pincer cofactor biosynthesis protein LarB [Anaerolineae bacterium]NIQ76506.1 nickel pincer cofactor biosynthesis protein LarB [Anaerolineae bacterium]